MIAWSAVVYDSPRQQRVSGGKQGSLDGTPRMSGAVRLHCVAKGCIRGLQLGPAQVVLGTVKGCLFEKLKACFVTAMLVHQ